MGIAMRGLILATLLLAVALSGEEPTSADPLVIADDTAEAIETYTLTKLRRAREDGPVLCKGECLFNQFVVGHRANSDSSTLVSIQLWTSASNQPTALCPSLNGLGN
jgi:hypothetical protein